MKTVFALVDCNNFYVSCERVFRPDLKSKPVVVLSNNDGCLISRSNEIKEYKIPMGAPYFKHRNQLSNMGTAVFSSNYALYGDMSQRVMETLHTFSDKVEVYSIDEAFVDLTGMNFVDLKKYGSTIKKTVEQWTGIPVSVGIAETKTLAKLANKLAKKAGGVYNLVGVSDLDNILDQIPVSDIWGVGGQYSKFLTNNGYHTAKDLKYAKDKLIKQKMTVMGLRTVWELRGKSCLHLDEIIPDKKEICTSRMFSHSVTDFEDLREAIVDYTSRAAEKLRSQKSLTNSISIFVATNFFRENPYYNYIRMPINSPTSNTIALTKFATWGLTQLYKPGYKYKKVGVLLTDLIPEDCVQLGLFQPAVDDPRGHQLFKTVDKINQSFGRGMIQLGSAGIGKDWAMKRKMKSPHYTTNWDDIPKVKAQ